jgi:hypothetical protein
LIPHNTAVNSAFSNPALTDSLSNYLGCSIVFLFIVITDLLAVQSETRRTALRNKTRKNKMAANPNPTYRVGEAWRSC